jgi:hypothetical protein
MIARQFDPVAELQSAFSVLMKNYMIAAIPLISLILCLAVFAVAFAIGGGAALMAGALTDLNNNPMALVPILAGMAGWLGIAALVACIIQFIGLGAAAAASDSAWRSGTADVSDGFTRALAKVGDLILYGIVFGIIVAVLIWTVVGAIAFGFFMLYAIPAIIVGGESAFQAMGTSWNLATKNAGPTFAAFIGMILAWFAVVIVNLIVGHIPVLGWIVQLALNALLGAFFALVSVRFYGLLRGTATATVVVPAAPPPPPPATPTA